VQPEAEVEVQAEVKLVVGVESKKLKDGDAQEGTNGDADAEMSELDQEQEQIKRHINCVNSLTNTNQPRKSLGSDPPTVNSRSFIAQKSGYIEAARLSYIAVLTPPRKAPVQNGLVTLQQKLSEKSLCKV
jgi:hypothetical protein